MPIGVRLFALARMTVTSTGTGTITLSAAVPGFLTFDLAGCSTASTGQVVGYAINDTAHSESGVGTYYSSAISLTRGSSDEGLKSTNSDSPIDMTNAAQVVITPTADTFKGPTITILTTASNGGTGTGTYTTPDSVSWLRVRQVGGGAGGSGTGVSAYVPGSSGGTTYFGSTSFLVCNGGGPTTSSTVAIPYSPGGSATIGSGLTGVAISGAPGGGGGYGSSETAVVGRAPSGAVSPFGGAGAAGYAAPSGSFVISTAAAATLAAIPNTGSGGGSAPAGDYATQDYAGYVGPGGGAGGYIDVIIPSTVLVSTYAYNVGAGGAGGVGGSSGADGAYGASGQIIIEEHYGP